MNIQQGTNTIKKHKKGEVEMSCEVLGEKLWAEVDLTAAKKNFEKISLMTRAQIIPVIKADAYGHGAIQLARLYDEFSCPLLAVSSIDEAEQLRLGGIKSRILILGHTPPQLAGRLCELKATQTVFNFDVARELSAQLERINQKIKIHIKVDTGMSRLGLMLHSENEISQVVRQVGEIRRMPGFEAEGIFTHFSSSDEPESRISNEQYTLFDKLCEVLKKEGIEIPLSHCCNSGGLLNFPEFHMDAVRPGIILYGLSPLGTEALDGFYEVMSLHSVIADIKKIKKGDRVGYGGSFEAMDDMTVATIPVGYADGYPRSLSCRGFMMVRGQKAPILGRVCMDQTIIDLSRIKGAAQGDDVIVIGHGIPAYEIAKLTGTISYEIVCGISKRVPRIYFKEGKISEKSSYIV